ncbi:uncharacterized, partial [Tachysurus ichikawai]
VNSEFLDYLDIQDDRDRRARLDSQDSQELTERKEAGDLKDLKAPSVSQDPKVPLGHQERTGCPDTLGSAVRRVSKVKQVPPDPQESSALRVQPERLVQSEREDTPDPQDHLESRVFQVQEGKKVQR